MDQVLLGAAGMLATILFWIVRLVMVNSEEKIMVWKWVLFNVMGFSLTFTTAVWWMGKVLAFSTGWGG